jgi:hypothetical protein
LLHSERGSIPEEALVKRAALLLVLVSLALAAGETLTAVGEQRGMHVGQTAPEITGGPWINSSPLSMEQLRGRVVFIEFWTYG